MCERPHSSHSTTPQVGCSLEQQTPTQIIPELHNHYCFTFSSPKSSKFRYPPEISHRLKTHKFFMRFSPGNHPTKQWVFQQATFDSQSLPIISRHRKILVLRSLFISISVIPARAFRLPMRTEKSHPTRFHHSFHHFSPSKHGASPPTPPPASPAPPAGPRGPRGPHGPHGPHGPRPGCPRPAPLTALSTPP